LFASYPLQYIQSFNYKPYEAIVRPGPGNCRVREPRLGVGELAAPAHSPHTTHTSPVARHTPRARHPPHLTHATPHTSHATERTTKDGALEDFPTCGWYFSMGRRVPDSQGFVCECDGGEIWDATFGTNKQRT
jgi:hypothetical protein